MQIVSNKLASMAFALAISTVGTPAYTAELLWTGDFETGDFSQYKSHLYGEGKHSTKKIVKSPVRAGKYATELTILETERGGSTRSELISRHNDSKIHFEWDGPEYWVGFSFMFKEWDSSAYTFFQIHAPNETKGDKCDYAGNTFSVWGHGADKNSGVSESIVVRVIENGGVSRGKGAGSNNTVVHKYPFPLNSWQDYVVNFKLSTKGKGFYKVWKGGKLIYSKSGLTNVNHKDSCGKEIPKDKRRHSGAHVGVYGPSTPGFRRIFYDEVRVAIGSDGYALVDPEQGQRQVNNDVDAVPKAPTIIE